MRGTWHFPGKANHKGLRNIEIGEPARRALVEEELVEEPVRKSVIGFGSRKCVDALTPCVGSMELEAMAHPFGYVSLHCVVKRIRLPQDCADAAKIGVQRLARRNRWKDISSRG